MAQRLVCDRLLFGSVLALTGFGLVMVYSASAMLAAERGLDFNPLFVKQSIAALLGLLAMIVVMHIDYRLLKIPAVTYAMMIAVLLMLVAVLFAPALNNSRRWIFIGGLSLQPSELAKLALIVYVAYQIDRKMGRLDGPAFLVPASVATGLIAVMVLLGGDLGTAVLICLPPFVMVVLAGISSRWLMFGGLMLLPVVAGAVLLTPYRMKRWLAFMNPEEDPLGSGFQVIQSQIAIGSGGFTGLGLGNSMQKLFFLPSPHADFIFSIVAEELGFLGVFGLMALFALFFWRGVLAGARVGDELGRYLAWGFTSMIALQALLHMSVAVGIAPTTGLPMPFISHGGSSMLVTLIACGVILNVSQHAHLARDAFEEEEAWLV